MEFEVLKRSHLKRNIIIGVMVVAIISAVVLNFTQAKYKLTESIPLINGTINYKRPDLNVVAMYQQDESGKYINIDTVPTSGYTLNTELSVCGQPVDGELVQDNTIPITFENGRVYIGINTKETKCYLYFDEQKLSLGDAILIGRTVQTRTFPATRSTAVTGTNGIGDIYSATDDDGTTYYFAGNPDDNWIYFAGFYWRIIRINGDGSIRIIYSGDNESGPVTTGEDTQYTTSVFNSSSNASYYVGLKYSNNSQHGNETNSTILGVLNKWYEDNISGTQYEQYISTEAGFCGDRETASGYNWSANPANDMYYAGYGRLILNANNIITTFKCDNSNDYYTVSVTGNGNRTLVYPIGLITADEASYAGLPSNGTTSDNYLYTGQYYWTMSPAYYEIDRTSSFMFIVVSEGDIGVNRLIFSNGIRPVINLDKNVTISGGNGSAESPFVIS